MLTNLDIDEAIVMAEVDVDERINRALEDFYRPDVEREAAMLYAGLPEAVKKMVNERAPEAVKRVVQL